MAKQEESSEATTQHIMELSSVNVNTLCNNSKKGKKGKHLKIVHLTMVNNQDENAPNNDDQDNGNEHKKFKGGYKRQKG